MLGSAVEVLHLHHRALLNEQSSELNRFFEGASPVVPQIQNYTPDVLLLKLGQQSPHILGRAAWLSLAPGTGGVEGCVEGRQVDIAKSEVLSMAIRQFYDPRLRF